MLSLYFCRAVRVDRPVSLYKEKIAYTGTSITRPEWLKLYRILKSGDIEVFDSVSRMSRNAEEGFTLYEDLYHKGIRLVFLKEDLQKSPVRQHCHDRDKCGFHLGRHQRVSDGVGQRENPYP